MASLRSSIPIFCLLVLLFTLVSEAREFLVGGNDSSWTIPSSNGSLNQWAEKNRFRIGDSLVWKYDGKSDSVLEVTKEDYESCKTSKPKKEYKDGNTKFKLERSGPFFFISVAEGHCEKGEKLVVVVLSDHIKHKPSIQELAPTLAPTPAPAQAPELAPAPVPSTSTAASFFLRGLFISVISLVGFMVLILV